jgi:hypothetical protein
MTDASDRDPSDENTGEEFGHPEGLGQDLSWLGSCRCLFVVAGKVLCFIGRTRRSPAAAWQ